MDEVDVCIVPTYEEEVYMVIPVTTVNQNYVSSVVPLRIINLD